MIEQKEDAYKGPFWRSNGAIFIVLKSLAEAERVLNKMLREQRIVDSKLAGFYAKYPPGVDVSDSVEWIESHVALKCVVTPDSVWHLLL